VADDCFPERVVTTFITLENGCYKSHHVLLDVLFLHGVYVLDALLNYACDLLACKSVHKHDPLVDKEFLCLVLDFNGLKHFD
jgi:hypothetical protein